MKVVRSDEHCATLLRAIAEPTRMSIVRALFGREQCVGDLCASLELEQHFVSRHLAVLRKARVVETRREAQRVVYRLTAAMKKSVRDGQGAIDLGCCELRFRDIQRGTV